MRLHKFIGGNQDELFFEEINKKFLVQESLVNENTRGMIQKYIVSLKAPAGIRIESTNDIYIFKPIKCDEKDSVESNDNYLWFAL